jgi:hypothetical protein
MIMFTTSDGLIFEGKTFQAVVRKMARLNWSRPEPKRRYMEDVVVRVQDMTGLPFPTKKLGATTFLLYLEYAGLGALRVTD